MEQLLNEAKQLIREDKFTPRLTDIVNELKIRGLYMENAHKFQDIMNLGFIVYFKKTFRQKDGILLTTEQDLANMNDFLKEFHSTITTLIEVDPGLTHITKKNALSLFALAFAANFNALKLYKFPITVTHYELLKTQ